MAQEDLKDVLVERVKKGTTVTKEKEDAEDQKVVLEEEVIMDMVGDSSSMLTTKSANSRK